ncbi:cytochrome P450 [Cupriavidus basilensis]
MTWSARQSAGSKEKNLWTDDELTRMVLNFTFAGHDTTTNTAANMFETLLKHREAWDEICRNPELIPQCGRRVHQICASGDLASPPCSK